MGEANRKQNSLMDELQKIVSEEVKTVTKLPNYLPGQIVTFVVGTQWVFGRLMPDAQDDFLGHFVMVEHPLMLIRGLNPQTKKPEIKLTGFAYQFGDVPANGIVAIRKSGLTTILLASEEITLAWAQFIFDERMRQNNPAPSIIQPKSSLILPT